MSWLHRLLKSPKRIKEPSLPLLGHDESQDRLRRASSYLVTTAGDQSTAIQETVASMSEIRSMIAQTEGHVNRSLSLTEEAQNQSQQRLKILDRLQKAMDAIKESNQLLNDLQESFHAIHNKTRVINDIVSKTQLLSFNASIEAARAGQFGKGFSVVAEEVGRLAQSSGKAAKEIESLLSESQLKATTVVEMMVLRANEGVNVTREVKQSFSEMTSAIAEVSTALANISQAAREQSVGIDRTAAAIDRINQAALKTKSSAEDILRLSENTRSLPQLGTENMETLLQSLSRRDANHISTSAPLNTVQADDPSFQSQE